MYQLDSATGFWVVLSNSTALTRSHGAMSESFAAYWHGHALQTHGFTFDGGKLMTTSFSGHQSVSFTPLNDSGKSEQRSLPSGIQSSSASTSMLRQGHWLGFEVNGQLSRQTGNLGSAGLPELSVHHGRDHQLLSKDGFVHQLFPIYVHQLVVLVASYVHHCFSKRISHCGLVTPSPSISLSHIFGIVSLSISHLLSQFPALLPKHNGNHTTVTKELIVSVLPSAR
jgi:hypothetical protein